MCVCGWVCLFFFFFQAEDGIRDGRVTGVQTCALPILLVVEHQVVTVRLARRCKVVLSDHGRVVAGIGEHLRHFVTIFCGDGRSEERRVGKECRSGWWRERYKKKEKRVWCSMRSGVQCG